MLTCSCDNDDADWWYDDHKEVGPLATKRMRRCCSCKERIAVGDDCKPFPRWRNVSDYSDPEVVVRIYGEGGEMPLTTWYLCDRCAGLYESLDSLGFCGLLGPARVKFDAHGATERVLWATQKDTARWVAMFMDRRRA